MTRPPSPTNKPIHDTSSLTASSPGDVDVAPDPAAIERLERILRPRQVSEVVGLSLPTIWRLRRRGRFPPPIRLSPGAVGWYATTVSRWLAARESAR